MFNNCMSAKQKKKKNEPKTNFIFSRLNMYMLAFLEKLNLSCPNQFKAATIGVSIDKSLSFAILTYTTSDTGPESRRKKMYSFTN